MADAYIFYLYLLYSNTWASGDTVKPTKDAIYPSFNSKKASKVTSRWTVAF